MSHDDNNTYDNRHTACYTEESNKDIEIHPHALQAHHLTREQIESALTSSDDQSNWCMSRPPIRGH
ncbi:hypothetical protein CPA40_03740 [Bifidobacterium callitrichos]|uniref:Uncharacterized protein n=1 Tax=Bifidobacterium callitrichos TaxID=762209 RepID=A0A2T3GBC1_9BIFI|nr:hypothetical protein CPA40_03740 [Bifidobacterium callitrichos]